MLSPVAKRFRISPVSSDPSIDTRRASVVSLTLGLREWKRKSKLLEVSISTRSQCRLPHTKILILGTP